MPSLEQHMRYPGLNVSRRLTQQHHLNILENGAPFSLDFNYMIASQYAWRGLKHRLFLSGPFNSLTASGIQLHARLQTNLRPQSLYRPLGDNDLRLLEIHPPLTSRRDELVRCTLSHESLEYSPEYKAWEAQADPELRMQKKTKAWYAYRESQQKAGILCPPRYPWGDYCALSYCWGTGVRSHEIIVNGQVFAVTETLESALRSVRGDWDGLRLWVDALCINQEDIAERGKEVRRMRKIYGDTGAVYVYLGSEADGSTEALQMIDRLAKLMRDGIDLALQYVLEIVMAAEDQYVPDREGIAAVFKLFIRPYWSRMWIIQELAMGDDQVLIACGDESIGLSELRQVLKFMVLNQETLNYFVPDEVASNTDLYSSTISLLWSIGLLQELALAPPDRTFGFLDLCYPTLRLAQYATATDPRDKIYGAMSLLPTRLVEIVDDREKNYTIPTREVFQKFTRAIIDLTNDLSIICISSSYQHSLSKLDLPSWSPDWTLQKVRSAGTGSSPEWFFGIDERYAAFDEQYNLPSTWLSDTSRSDGGRKPKIRFLNEDKLLVCEGFEVATVAGVCSELEMLMKDIADSVTTTTSETVENPYGSDENTAEVLARTLLLDASGELSKNSIIFKVPWLSGDNDSDYATYHIKVLDDMVSQGWGSRFLTGGIATFDMFRHKNSEFSIGGRRFKDYFPKSAVACPENASQLEFSIVIANLMGRRLMTTTSGHIGLAPENVFPEDKIFVIVGCSMPVILRRDSTDNRYHRVVGECYVDGFMTGEAMNALDDGKYQLQDLVLC